MLISWFDLAVLSKECSSFEELQVKLVARASEELHVALHGAEAAHLATALDDASTQEAEDYITQLREQLKQLGEHHESAEG